MRQTWGGEPVRLTDDGAVESHLVYAHDGESILFARTEGSDTSIWRIGALGGNLRKVAPDAQTPSPSPDGRLLAYSAGQMFETRNLFVADVASGRVRQVTLFTKSTEGPLSQDWLPDSRHLVVSYYSTPRAQLVSDLGVLDIESGDITRLTLNLKGLLFDPSVSTDGARVMVTAQAFAREATRPCW